MVCLVRSRSLVSLLLLAGLACTKRDQAPAPAPPDVSAPNPSGTTQGPRFVYPEAARVEQIDDYHGTKVADPYRWLEDPDAPQTRTWIEAQNELTFGYLDTIEEREAIGQRLEALWNYERFSVPRKVGPRYVYERNDGLQNQAVLYVLDGLDASPRVLLDPNTLSDDGTVALSKQKFSPDGSLMAYGVAAAGSDWETWRVRDVATGQDLQDTIEWVKFAEASWARDGKGFYYSGYDAPQAGAELEQLNYDQKVYFHALGTPQSQDVLVYARPDHKEWGFDAEVTEDGRYLVITVRVGTDPKHDIFFQKLGANPRPGAAPPRTVELLSGFSAHYEFVGNDGPVFFFLTDEDAPRGRLVAIDTRKPQPSNWAELVGEQPETLTEAEFVGNRFLTTYLRDAHAVVRRFSRIGKDEGEVALPGLGSVQGFHGQRKDTETFFSYESFSQPSTIYRYDVLTNETSVFRAPELRFDPADFVTEQVDYTSRDGTRVPMFVTHHRDVHPGTKGSGPQPTYLYGYGGFNISLTPRFSVPNLVWMEMGGVFAQPNLRGGGEFGEQWHLAGTKVNKQNVFDDFIGAAEWLIAAGYTAPEKLAIGGRSNGGLLVGATMTQRPELFAAAIPGVGVMDMLRFNQFTIGWAWQSDYGSPQDPEEFAALLAYSPYHNLEQGTAYPATLVYTADHDDRVVPAHSFKFAAALQWAHRGDAPVMIRIDTKAGHGAGKPVGKQIEEWADLWGFLVENLHMKVPPLPR